MLKGSLTLSELSNVVAIAEQISRASGQNILFEFGTQGSHNLHFSFIGATDEQVDRAMAEIRAALDRHGVEAEVQREPFAFRDYFSDPVTVEGPDGQRFELENIRASTVVGDVARSVMNEYQDSHRRPGETARGRQQAVVDLVNGEGGTLRLDPRMTLHDAGVRPGAVLRVHPERSAGAVNPLARDEALARVRGQVLDYASNHPGVRVEANSLVAPTEYLLGFQAPGFAPPKRPGEAPRPIDRHEVVIYLPPDFPMAAPEAWWQTEIFHPNIDRKTGGVCLGALQKHYQPALDFGELCQMLVDIARYRLYSPEPGNYLDGEASMWALSPEGQITIERAGGYSVLGRVVFEGRCERVVRLRRLDQ